MIFFDNFPKKVPYFLSTSICDDILRVDKGENIISIIDIFRPDITEGNFFFL